MTLNALEAPVHTPTLDTTKLLAVAFAVAGCGIPGFDGTVRSPTRPSPSPPPASAASTPSTLPSVTTEEAVVVVVPQGRAQAEALDMVMRRNIANWCVLASHVELHPASLDVEALAAKLTGPSGVVGGGIGFVGDLESAVGGMGGTHAIVGTTGRETWLIRRVGDDAAAVGAPAGSWAAYRLAHRTLADGRTMWILQGDLVAGRPC